VFLAEALAFPTGLLSAMFLTRQFGPADYGTFSLACIIISWVQWTIGSLFTRITIKAVAENADRADGHWQEIANTIYFAQIVLSVLAGILMFLLADVLTAHAGGPRLALLLRAMAVDIPLFTSGMLHRNVLIGLRKHIFRSLLGVTRWIGRLVLLLLLVRRGGIVGGAVALVLTSVIELTLAMNFVRIIPRPGGFQRHSIGTMLMPQFFCSLSTRLYERLDIFLLTSLGGTMIAAGWYSAAQNFSLLPGVVAMALSPVLLAELSRARAREETAQFQSNARNALRTGIVFFGVAAILAGVASDLILLLFQQAFSPAGPLLSILIFGATALLVVSIGIMILTAADYAPLTAVLAMVLIPLAAVGYFVVVPHFGAIGAALIFTVVALVGAIMVLRQVWQKTGVAVPLPTILRSLLFSSVITVIGVSWHSSGSPLLSLVIKLLLLTGLFAAGIWFSGELSPDEKQRILRRLPLRTPHPPALTPSDL
jgi:O-antigen/teichoic acid export membrane protein